MEQHPSQIQYDLTVGRRDRQCLAKAFDRQQRISLDSPKVSNLIVKLHRTWTLFLLLAQLRFEIVNIKVLLQLASLLLGRECEKDVGFGHIFEFRTMRDTHQVIEYRVIHFSTVENFLGTFRGVFRRWNSNKRKY